MLPKSTSPIPISLLLFLFFSPSPSASLSSHSPQDLFAYPKYQILLDDQPLLASSLRSFLSSPPSPPSSSSASHPPPPPEDAQEEVEARHLMKTASGQSFLCTVPVAAPPSPPPSPADSADLAAAEEAERAAGLERGLELLEGMRGGCLWLKQGWFTYSFCYGDIIRQFHEIRTAGSPSPSEDPNADAYTLGQAPSPLPAPNQKPKYGSGTALSNSKLSSNRIPATLGGGAGNGLGWDDGGRYLSQKWEGGTVCDKTGAKRSVEVQFHCNTQTPDRIFLIRETSICNYVMLIHTPRLCAEPIFLERRRGTGPDDSPAGGGGNQQIEQVRCRPIVDRLGLEAITPESEAKDKDNVDGTAGGEENQDEDVIMVVQTDAKQDDLKVVFDQQTGEVVQVQDMKGNIVFDEIKVEDLVGRVGDDRAPDTEDEDLETLKGLHDLAKIMRNSIASVLSSTGTGSPDEEEDDRPTFLAFGGLESLLEALNPPNDLSKTSTSTGAEGEGEPKDVKRKKLEDYLEAIQDALLIHKLGIQNHDVDIVGEDVVVGKKGDESLESENHRGLKEMFGKTFGGEKAVESEAEPEGEGNGRRGSGRDEL